MEEVQLFTAVKNRKGQLCLRIAGSSEDLSMNALFWLKMIDIMELWINALGHDRSSAKRTDWYEKERELRVEKIKLILEYQLKLAKENPLNVPLAVNEKCPFCGCSWIITAHYPRLKNQLKSIVFFTWNDRLCLNCGKKWPVTEK